MAETTTRIQITLVGHYWDIVPEYTIYWNDSVSNRGRLPTVSGEPHTITLESNEPLTEVRVGFENKSSDQSVLNLNRTRLIRDMLLEVRELRVNDYIVPVTPNSHYVLDQKNTYQGRLVKEIPHIDIMGYNGVLIIKINNP
jgi:hypothetical protein